LPHLATTKLQSKQNNIIEKAPISMNKKQIEEPETGEITVYEVKNEPLTKNKNANKKDETITNPNSMIQKMPINYKDAQVQISDYLNSSKVDKSTQSPKRERKLKLGEKEEESSLYIIKQIPDENFYGEYKPPPLFFNSELSKTDLAVDSSRLVDDILNKQSFINNRIEYLNDALKKQEDIESEY
jgi:hypothetical protein